MNNINFYKKIKSLLNDHAVSSDHDAIWNNVYGEMQKKKRRRRLLILFLFPVLFGLISIPFIFESYDNSDIQIKEKQQKSTENVIAQPMAIDLKKSLPHNTSRNVKISPNSELNNYGKTISSNKKTTKSSDVIIVNNVSSSNELFYNIIKTPHNNIEIVNIDESITLSNTKSTLDNSRELINEHTITLALINPNPAGIQSISLYDIVPGTSQKGLKLDVTKRDLWTLGFYFAPGVLTNSFSSEGEVNANLTQKRNASEKALEELTVGTELSYHFSDNWFLSAGIEYNRLIDKFEASYTDTITKIDNEALVGTVINSRSSQRENLYGAAAVTIIRKVYQKTYNRYHLLNIPLILGYQNNLDQISIGAHAGLGLQSLFSVSGHAFNIDKLVSLNNYSLNNEKIYNTSFHFNAILGLDISYRATPNWRMYLAPEFIASIDGMTNRNSDIKQRVNRYRIKLGMRYTL